jgi:N-acetylmuramoyl-L-alanine amidase
MQKDGEAIVALALKHIGETYKLGARAPLGDSKWKGPWDCAEFVSWCVYQATDILYGVEPADSPMLADAFTGFWAQQSKRDDARVPVETASRICGAIVLRIPRTQQIGHIAFCDGKGGTVEAHSSKTGVIKSKVSGRRWDCGVLVPGVEYFQNEDPVVVEPPAQIYRLTSPLMRGPQIRKIQRALTAAGFVPGRADGIYGPQTAHAVHLFQAARGLVADGEAGPATLKALGL